MKLFRTLRGKHSKKCVKKDSFSGSCFDVQSKRIELEVKLKVNKKYENRSLEVVRHTDESGRQEWKMYVVKHADYTSYDYFRLSQDFITQLFNTTDSKCTLLLASAILHFKMRNISDKWRLVEFLRANLETEAHSFIGSLKRCPLPKNETTVRVLFKHSSLAVVSAETNKILLHTSLANFEMAVCKSETISFVCKNLENISDFWSIQLENIEKLASLIAESNDSLQFPFALTHHYEPPKYSQPPHVLYTDF